MRECAPSLFAGLSRAASAQLRLGNPRDKLNALPATGAGASTARTTNARRGTQARALRGFAPRARSACHAGRIGARLGRPATPSFTLSPSSRPSGPEVVSARARRTSLLSLSRTISATCQLLPRSRSRVESSMNRRRVATCVSFHSITAAPSTLRCGFVSGMLEDIDNKKALGLCSGPNPRPRPEARRPAEPAEEEEQEETENNKKRRCRRPRISAGTRPARGSGLDKPRAFRARARRVGRCCCFDNKRTTDTRD
jgi:hypothetical protein